MKDIELELFWFSFAISLLHFKFAVMATLFSGWPTKYCYSVCSDGSLFELSEFSRHHIILPQKMVRVEREILLGEVP